MMMMQKVGGMFGGKGKKLYLCAVNVEKALKL